MPGECRPERGSRHDPSEPVWHGEDTGPVPPGGTVNTSRPRSILVALAAMAALAACGADEDAGSSADEPASQAPSDAAR